MVKGLSGLATFNEMDAKVSSAGTELHNCLQYGLDKRSNVGSCWEKLPELIVGGAALPA